MSNYTFSISDFIIGNGADSDLLRYQITISTINTSIIKLHGTVSNVFLHFSEVLSESEETTLYNIINTHDPETQNIPYGSNEIQIKINETTSSTIYNTVASIVWPPSFPFGGIISIKAISSLDLGESYDIRIINYTKNQIITEMLGLTNTNIGIQKSLNILNQPDQLDAILEVQMKVDSSTSSASLLNVTISYY